MTPQLTCYGGVGEIGGNKILLEDKDTRLLLDFGTGFSDGSDYYDDVVKPRGVNGAGDLFEFGLLPEIEGLYSEQALQNTDLRHTRPKIDAVILSHYHWDHMGRIPYVDTEIPVYCGETTSIISGAYSDSTGSPLDEHELKKFRTGDRFTIGSVEVEPVHVDHSIPGAYGFILRGAGGTVAYTGDFRFHGPAGSMTSDFVKAASDAKLDLLVTEGTRVSLGDSKQAYTEDQVQKEASEIVQKSRKLVLSTFKGNDIDRINTFQKAASAAGRRLVVSMKAAMLLKRLEEDRGLSVPKLGRDVMVYLRRKRSGKFDDKDYHTWERQFLDFGVPASVVKEKQDEYFVHLDVWNFPEVIDIKPDRGGTYIHAATEAFNEEGEREETVLKNWIDHLGFSYHQLHASGHAPMAEVGKLVRGAGAKKVVPVHTESPGLFKSFQKGQDWALKLPEKGIPIQF